MQVEPREVKVKGKGEEITEEIETKEDGYRAWKNRENTGEAGIEQVINKIREDEGEEEEGEEIYHNAREEEERTKENSERE